MLKVKEMLLDFRENGNRPGAIIIPNMIIVHRTGNPGSSALANRNYFNTEANDQIYASAHYCVDGEQIIRCLPENELGYHCRGQNQHTIGIEIAEPLTAGAYQNALELIVDICRRHGWSWTSEFIRPHSYYDPVNRPFDPFSWEEFRAGRRHPKDLFDGRQFYTDVRDKLAAAGGRV